MTTTVASSFQFASLEQSLASLQSNFDTYSSSQSNLHSQFSELESESKRVFKRRELRSCQTYDMEDLLRTNSARENALSKHESQLSLVSNASSSSLQSSRSTNDSGSKTPKQHKSPKRSARSPKSTARSPKRSARSPKRNPKVVKGTAPVKSSPPQVKVNLEKGKLELSDEVKFAPNSSTVSNKSSLLLDQVCKAIRENLVRIRIDGHTSQGRNEKKLVSLSKARAESVMKVLIRKGIEKGYLEYEGFGSSQPPEEGMTAKRVEFIVLEKA
eukprot:CAMPEP_0117442612 /NCGR_PEP_ID=MMETSP0759-20121206/4247_1 /TAXON_ID=63605 /ORGANISM="Percolomonas cosmopolitus, Strain WS" /LENGTH=270 /DNA_ID=CAMNT_0005234517 /DNA_START=489 /DNA_END=1301 /DNA_ORIENTATION=-